MRRHWYVMIHQHLHVGDQLAFTSQIHIMYDTTALETIIGTMITGAATWYGAADLRLQRMHSPSS